MIKCYLSIGFYAYKPTDPPGEGERGSCALEFDCIFPSSEELHKKLREEMEKFGFGAYTPVAMNIQKLTKEEFELYTAKN